MQTSDFDYTLPTEQIAQEPLPDRTASRLMVLRRADGGTTEHRHIRDLPDLLTPGDLLVLNDTRVVAARVFGRWRDTPGRVEALFVEPTDQPDVWLALCRSSRPPQPGLAMVLAEGAIRASVLARETGGRVRLRIETDGDLLEVLDRHGVPPLPPYIRRGTHDARTESDRERYQTVYARERGSVAAPTAGLHFTPELLATLAARGIPHAFVTLHVGPGTFKPVTTDAVQEHVMDAERYHVSPEAAQAIAAARGRGGRIVAVGSTTVRTLETVAAEHGGGIVPCSGRSSIFIHPPFRFLATNAMLTNFHLPRSTLLMMVSALAGREVVLAAYAEAVRAGYRFYSYGDAMLIL